jgi:hypothetical protein
MQMASWTQANLQIMKRLPKDLALFPRSQAQALGMQISGEALLRHLIVYMRDTYITFLRAT